MSKALSFIILAAGITALCPAPVQAKAPDCEQAHCSPGQIVAPYDGDYPVICATRDDMHQFDYDQVMQLQAENDHDDAAGQAWSDKATKVNCPDPDYTTYVLLFVAAHSNRVDGRLIEISPVTDRSKTYWTTADGVHPAQ